MFEFRVVELKKGDEFTADNGDSWWKVELVELPTKRSPGVNIHCVCLSHQLQDNTFVVGGSESFLFLPKDTVIVR